MHQILQIEFFMKLHAFGMVYKCNGQVLIKQNIIEVHDTRI